MIDEPQIAALLRAGQSISAIVRATGAGRHRVTVIRDGLGIPRHKPGPARQTLAETIEARTDPYDDGHLVWTGRLRDVDGVPLAYYEGVETTAYRLVWLMATGLWPSGPLRVTCDQPSCVAYEHLHASEPPALAALGVDLQHLAELLEARTEPVPGRGGHLRWLGHAPRGVPVLRVGDIKRGRRSTVARWLWLVNTASEPEGRVRRTCTFPGCVRFEHLACRLTRTRKGTL